MVHHKKDFGLEASWTFTATSHGKGPCDGIGASVKSTATRTTLTSGRSITTPNEFYDFTVEFNAHAQRASTDKELPIHAFYVDASAVDKVYDDVLKIRWKQLPVLGKNSFE